MRKILLLVAMVFGFALSAQAQNTIVTATVVDPNGTPYAFATGSASLVCPGNAAPTHNGTTVQRNYPAIGLDGNGKFTQTVYDVNQLDQSGCAYRWTITWTDGITTFIATNIGLGSSGTPITGAGPVNISAPINAFAVPIPKSSIFGTILSGQVAVGSATNTITGSSGLTYGAGTGLCLGGATSGQACIGVPAAAGTPNLLLLPTTTGAPGQVLETNGANPQQLTWTAGGGGGTLPSVSDAIRYASPSGNDANDGLSWGTAKLTVYAAILSLPGGNAGTLTAGTGRVYLSSQSTGVAYGGPAANGGMWIMGSGDPNFGSPPTGWLKFGGPLEIYCGGPEQGAANGHSVMCQLNGGGTTDRLHPLVWISASPGPISLDHIYFQNYRGSFVKYGIDSNNNRTGTGGSSGFSLRDVGWNFGSCALGLGPGIDIGSNSFWIWMRDIVGAGCKPEIFLPAAAPTGFSRTSNVVTVTTTTTNDIAVNDWVTIQNATDTSFNGSYQVSGVTSGTVFTFNQNGPNATSGSGQIVTAASAAISINPGTGNGSGLIFINNINLNNGGVRLQEGIGGGGLYLSQANYEGDFTTPDGPMIYVPNGGQTPMNLRVDSIEQSDLFNAANAVEVDNNIVPDQVQLYRIAGPVVGAMNTFGGIGDSTLNTVSPARLGEAGVWNGRLVGGTDIARRIFAPSAAVTTNLASTNPANWTYILSTGTITTGLRAPDGTSNAASMTSNSGQAIIQLGYDVTTAVTVGDIYVFGVWAKIVGSGSGFSNTQAIRFVLNGHGNGTGDYCAPFFSNSVQSFAPLLPSIENRFVDGQWAWLSGVCKVYTNPNSAGVQLAGFANNPAMVTTYYNPTVLRFPNGTISDNEAVEIAYSMSGLPTNCSVAASVCMSPGQQFGLGGSTQFMGYMTHANTANRTYTFQDSSGTVPLEICTGQIALTTGAIASGTRATNTLSCTGLATATDSISCSFNSDTNAVTGYAPSASGGLTLKTWVSANTINVDQVNNTGGSITPGAATVNCKGVR